MNVQKLQQNIKTQFYPKISQAKQQELSLKIQSIRHQDIRRSEQDELVVDPVTGQQVRKRMGMYERPWLENMSKTADRKGSVNELNRHASTKTFSAAARNLSTSVHGQPSVSARYERAPAAAASIDVPKASPALRSNLTKSVAELAGPAYATPGSLQPARRSQSKPQLPQQFKHKNYLAEMRAQREQMDSMVGSADPEDYGYSKRKVNNELRNIDQLFNDRRLNDYEKLDAVKRKADLMES